MKQRKARTPSRWHEEVYHAASRCQAASLSLTARGYHGLLKACQVERQKTGGCFASRGSLSPAWIETSALGSAFGVEPLCLFKGLGLILLLLVAHGEDNPEPQVGQRTDCLAMTFPARAKAKGGVLSPGLGLRTRPRKLLQSVAQGFDTRIATMRLARVAALVGDGRRASPRLQTGRFRRACAISADLGEQARSQSLAGAGQTAEDEVCFRHQKKALNPLIIALPATSKGARPIFLNRSSRVEQPRPHAVRPSKPSQPPLLVVCLVWAASAPRAHGERIANRTWRPRP